MTPCLYKGMKIDSLDRFLEGKISICLYCRYDIKVSEKVNKNKLDHEKIVQKPAAGRIFFLHFTLKFVQNCYWEIAFFVFQLCIQMNFLVSRQIES